MNELIDEMIKEFEESKGGSTSFIFDDGDEYHTDTGYAMEGINAFAERLNKRLISMTNGEVIMAMFPEVEEVTREISSASDNIVVRDNSFLGAINRFHTDWWNAPYKAEREVRE